MKSSHTISQLREYLAWKWPKGIASLLRLPLTCLSSIDSINCEEESQEVDSDMSVVPNMYETVRARGSVLCRGSPGE